MTEKKKTGPGKGNRTRGADRRGNRSGRPGTPPEEQEGIRAANEARAENTEHYKKVAEIQAGAIRYGQEYAKTLFDGLTEYIKDRRDKGKMITKGGLVDASGLSNDTYYKYRNGDADYMLYMFMDSYGITYDHEGELVQVETAEGIKEALLLRLSEIIKRAERALQIQLEENCYSNKGNPLGSIAGMRNYFDWQENPNGPTTNNNTLVLNNVASLEEARAAMKRLNG